MTRTELISQVARITGETFTTVHHRGFTLVSAERRETEADDVELVLDCPFCGRPVPYPGHGGGSDPLAECARCDVYFGFDPGEVYPVPRGNRAGASGRPG
jgi:hypothetical protein